MSIKGFSTKYALTSGIQPCTVRPQPDEPDSKYVYTVGRIGVQLVRGKTFFESLDDAIENAREQALRKLRSLDRSSARIASLAATPLVSSKRLT